jgi:hypothetical protein
MGGPPTPTFEVITMTTTATYPVHVQAELDPGLSRWLWLVKWILVVPHYVVLAFLWLAFIVATTVAFFAILFTGRYPRTLFDFNVGVLRWTWRVGYYAYGALGTDRYPPFTLADDPDYPAHLSVDYPDHLSQGLVLVKSWLLALPHYLIVGLFVGGGLWSGWRMQDWQWSWGGGGLIGLLVLIGAVALAVTGNYPRSLFDVVLGMNRWALRVAGYAALMTDAYPPFRLDLGGDDAPQASPTAGEVPDRSPLPGTLPAGVAASDGRPWGPGSITSAVIGAVLVLTATGPVVAGAATLWADRTQRAGDGYLTSPSATLTTGGSAITSEPMPVDAGGPSWVYPRNLLGDLRLRFSAADPSRSIFVGVTGADAAARFLAGVQYATVTDFDASGADYREHPGGVGPDPRTAGDIWVASSTGTGTQTLTWSPNSLDMVIVVMNADGAPGVAVHGDAAATVPSLVWVSVGLLIAGLVLLAIGAALIAVPASRASRAEVRPVRELRQVEH